MLMTLDINKIGRSIHLLLSLNSLFFFFYNIPLKLVLCSIIKLIEFHVNQQMLQQQKFGFFSGQIQLLTDVTCHIRVILSGLLFRM